MIVCIECEQPFKVGKIGVILEEQFRDRRPYRLWATDLLICGCGHEIAITRPEQLPIAEHFQQEYAEVRARHTPTILVHE